MLTVIAEKENIDENNGKILIKDRSDCNHVQNVYRLNIGDELRVIDGEYEYFTKISEISKKEIAVKILEKKEDSYSLSINIDIAMGKKEDKNILYIIGPEGGITADEVDFLKNNKAIEISLGKRILRAETAAIVVCGIIANFYI